MKYKFIILALSIFLYGHSALAYCGDSTCAVTENFLNCPTDCSVDSSGWQNMSSYQIASAIRTEMDTIISSIPATEIQVNTGVDCGTDLQAAIDSLYGTGGVIKIVGSGVCYIDAQIKIGSYMKLTQDDPTATIELSDSYPGGFVLFTNKNRGGKTSQTGGNCRAPVGSAREWVDCNIVFDGVNLQINLETDNVFKLVAVNNFVVINSVINQAAGAVFYDLGVHGRYIANSRITNAGRGGSTIDDYQGGGGGSIPARYRGNSFWVGNLYESTGDDAMGNVFAIEPAWSTRTFSVALGNTVRHTTHATGVKFGLVNGVASDFYIAHNSMERINGAGIHIRQNSSSPVNADTNVVIDNNTIARSGYMYYEGTRYYDFDTTSWVEYSQYDVNDPGGAVYNSDLVIAALTIRTISGSGISIGNVAITNNHFWNGTSYTVYNDNSALSLSGNTYVNTSCESGGRPSCGTQDL